MLGVSSANQFQGAIDFMLFMTLLVLVGIAVWLWKD
jgi:hypothetical protein